MHIDARFLQFLPNFRKLREFRPRRIHDFSNLRKKEGGKYVLLGKLPNTKYLMTLGMIS